MSNVINLTKGYIETIRTIKNQLIIFLIVALGIGIMEETFIAYGCGYTVIFLISQVFSYEDISGIDFLVATLPVSKKEYVQSRYVAGLIAIILGCILVTGSYFIVEIVNEVTIPYLYFLIIAIISSSITVSINIVIFLKYGSLTGRFMVTFLNLAGFFLPVFMIEGLNSSNILLSFISTPIILLIGVILIATLILYISYCISLNLYNKKEVKK